VRTAIADDGSSLVTANGTVFRTWNIRERPATSSQRFDLSALAIAEDGRIAALGFRGGYVRAQSLAALADIEDDDQTVDFIGHRGPVTAIAMSVAHNLIITGGDDGVVRTWNLATMTPSDALMRHGGGAITTLALAPSGEWIVSGAEGTASLWNIGSGERVGEYPVNGFVTYAKFAPERDRFAIGDSTGNIFVAEPGAAVPQHAFRADSAIRSLAFAPRSDYVVSGDELGHVRAWSLDPSATAMPPAIELSQAIRWLAYEPGGAHLLVQTEAWFHRIEMTEAGLVITGSRLLPPGLEPGAVASEDGGLRLVGGVDLGRIVVADVEFADAKPDSPLVADSASLNRDWGRVLGYIIDDAGVATRLTQ
jgi:WD domain, G-beta repeat